MAKEKLLDIAHISFLDMIKEVIALNRAASAKKSLIRNAIQTAENMPKVPYLSFEAYVDTVERATKPIAIVEGKAIPQGDSVFGLKLYPFEPSIKNYVEVFENLPEGHADFISECNKPTKVSERYRVGEGSCVSPFCSIHQPMRITIGGRKIQVYQLGCKSASGKKGFADRWIEEAGVAREKVVEIIDEHMCCYNIKKGE